MVKQINRQLSLYGFIRTAAAVPPLKIGDVEYNLKQILTFIQRAEKSGAQIIVFPELSITGYTLGDLFHQRLLLEKTRAALSRLKNESKNFNVTIVVGLPWQCEGKIFNTAAVIQGDRFWD